MTRRLVATEGDEGARIDAFLAENLPEFTRSALQRLCAEGAVRCRGVAAAKNLRLRAGDEIEIDIPAPRPLAAEAEDIPLDIVYEDEHLIVVNKPRGMVVHPAAGNYTGTLVNALLHRCRGQLSGIGGVERPGIVHRLDKDTSGLIVAAKTDAAHRRLSAMLQKHDVARVYHAVVEGHLREPAGTVDKPLGRDPADRKRISTRAKRPRSAVTHYRVLAEYPRHSYVECRLETGRTHQIRVHLASLGHPVAGDTVYGGKPAAGLSGQCLHAKELHFRHPITGEMMDLVTDLPEAFARFLERIAGQRPG